MLRSLIKLGKIAEPGTAVALPWGEEDEPSSPAVEPHEQTTVRATVQPAPYVTDRRKADW